jgi:hypothetical protein
MTPKEIAKLITENVDDPLSSDDRWVGGQLGGLLAGITPTMYRGKIALFDSSSEDVTDRFNNITFYAEDHPEGSDRGGIVVIAEKDNERSYYDGTTGGWVEIS